MPVFHYLPITGVGVPRPSGVNVKWELLVMFFNYMLSTVFIRIHRCLIFCFLLPPKGHQLNIEGLFLQMQG